MHTLDGADGRTRTADLLITNALALHSQACRLVFRLFDSLEDAERRSASRETLARLEGLFNRASERSARRFRALRDLQRANDHHHAVQP
jgi:hypothetical protein